MVIFGLGTCDSCRKARKALPNAEFVDVRAEGIPTEILDAALERFGNDVLNTRSTTWRSLDEVQRQGTPRDLITEHPLLMKRPLVQDGDNLYLGWGKDVQKTLAEA